MTMIDTKMAAAIKNKRTNLFIEFRPVESR
jgi:hypothetical protein